jgi:hypothetical protein
MADALEIPLKGPKGEPVDFLRTIASHGVAELPPNELSLEERTLDELVSDDPGLDWCALGAGRMLRAPTVFEDVVKTT